MGSKPSKAKNAKSSASLNTKNGSFANNPQDANGKGAPPTKERELLIHFATQTGTSETYAKRIAKEAPGQVGWKTDVKDLENFDVKTDTLRPATPDDDVVHVFLLSTHGDGGPPDDGIRFHKWLKSPDRKPNEFAGVRYTVLALGNRTYEYFCGFGKYTDARLTELGGERIYAFGEDDEPTRDKDFNAWVTGLYAALKVLEPAGSGNNNDAAALSSAAVSSLQIKRMALEFIADLAVEASPRIPPPNTSAASRHYYHATSFKIRQIRELVADGSRSTLHVEFELPPTLQYSPACTMVLVPDNDPAVVTAFANALGWKLNEWFDLPNDAGLFPTPCTFETALSRYCALTSVPTRECLLALANTCEDPDPLTALVDKYDELVDNPKLNLFEILSLDNPPKFRKDVEPATILEALPRMMAREYTVASSQRVLSDAVALLVAVVATELPRGRTYKGVCTHALSRRIATKQDIFGYLKASTFTPPTALNTPVLYVATGTGLAPMRALLQDRAALMKDKPADEQLGAATLVFGVRGVGEVYYEDEFNSYVASGALTRFCVCYSREPPPGITKARVTDGLRGEVKDLVATTLANPTAHMYVCGLAKAGHDVKNCATEVLQSSGVVDNGTARVEEMVKEGRLQEELWG